jgi:hypothetical protein
MSSEYKCERCGIVFNTINEIEEHLKENILRSNSYEEQVN